MILNAASWIYRRHTCKLMCFPWLLLQAIDARSPLPPGRQVLQKFASTPACCMRSGLARQLRKRGLTVEDFMSPFWQGVLQVIAMMKTLQIADVERRHRRNSAMTPLHKAWHNFVASYILAEGRSLMQTWLQEQAMLLPGIPGVVDVPVQPTSEAAPTPPLTHAPVYYKK